MLTRETWMDDDNDLPLILKTRLLEGTQITEDFTFENCQPDWLNNFENQGPINSPKLVFQRENHKVDKENREPIRKSVAEEEPRKYFLPIDKLGILNEIEELSGEDRGGNSTTDKFNDSLTENSKKSLKSRVKRNPKGSSITINYPVKNSQFFHFQKPSVLVKENPSSLMEYSLPGQRTSFRVAELREPLSIIQTTKNLVSESKSNYQQNPISVHSQKKSLCVKDQSWANEKYHRPQIDRSSIKQKANDSTQVRPRVDRKLYADRKQDSLSIYKADRPAYSVNQKLADASKSHITRLETRQHSKSPTFRALESFVCKTETNRPQTSKLSHALSSSLSRCLTPNKPRIPITHDRLTHGKVFRNNLTSRIYLDKSESKNTTTRSKLDLHKTNPKSPRFGFLSDAQMISRNSSRSINLKPQEPFESVRLSTFIQRLLKKESNKDSASKRYQLHLKMKSKVN